MQRRQQHDHRRRRGRRRRHPLGRDRVRRSGARHQEERVTLVRASKEKLHVGRPNIGDRDALMARFNDLLDRRWLTNSGPFVNELEQRLAAWLGVQHVVAVCNATVALEIAIKALELCDVEALTRVAERHELALLFDAAHAFGCSRGGVMVGNFGTAEVFSFHATKFFNTFEGGAIATNDATLARKMRLMTNFGFAGYDDVVSIGTNGKMSEIAAAMGITNLESIQQFIDVNRANYERYRAGLAGIPAICMLEYDDRDRT